MRRWINLLVIFVASLGVAIGCTGLFPSRPGADSDSVYQAAEQSHENSSGSVSTIAFPADYRQQFVQYATVDCPNSRIVRKMYVNPNPLETLAASQTVPEGTVIVMETHSAHAAADGRLVPDRLNNVFIRAKTPEPNANPDSGQWHSVWYSPDGDLVSDDQSSCISCHTSVRQRDYLFTLPALIAAAQTGKMQYQQTEFGTSVCR
ncbi:MAG: cytochrome P460 family protein [Elainella sp.]